jgi:hypothetical protein
VPKELWVHKGLKEEPVLKEEFKVMKGPWVLKVLKVK